MSKVIKYCPECKSSDLVKVGFIKSRQNYRCNLCGRKTINPLTYKADKKTGITDWREWSEHLTNGQKLHEKASNSQDSCNISISTEHPYIVYQPISDMHLGAIGCDYQQLRDFTDSVLKHDFLFFSTTGDHTDNFNRFNNMYAMHQMQMSPSEQTAFFKSWVEETKHKFLFSTWGNHEEMEEKASGINSTKSVLNQEVVYFNGIGIANLKINDVSYKIAVTHKTRYSSSFNKTHGLKQLARKEIPDADIYIAGHTHDPAFEMTFERGLWQLFIVLGSLKKNDGYAKRYFAYYSSTQMTSIVFNTQKKELIPFLNLDQAFQFVNQKEK